MKSIYTQQENGMQSGFTLVEMLVSISLFAMVVTMSVGVLLVLIDANGRAQSMQLVMTNLSFALDSMTREIRTGTNWYCGDSAGEPPIPTDASDSAAATEDCADGNYISISESGNSLTEGYATDRVTYWFDDDAHGTVGGENVGAIMRKLGGPSGSDSGWVALTGKDVDIDKVVFRVDGTDRWIVTGGPGAGDTTQPTLTLYIRGKAGYEQGASASQLREFKLQTSITQRTLDL